MPDTDASPHHTPEAIAKRLLEVAGFFLSTRDAESARKAIDAYCTLMPEVRAREPFGACRVPLPAGLAASLSPESELSASDLDRIRSIVRARCDTEHARRQRGEYDEVAQWEALLDRVKCLLERKL